VRALEILKQKEFLLPDIEDQFELPEIQEFDNQFRNHSYEKYAKKTNGYLENGRDTDYTTILPFGISKSTIRQLADFYKTNMKIVENVKDAQIVVTTKSQYRRSPKVITNAELDGTPVHILRKNTVSQISEFIKNVDSYKKVKSSIQEALEDAENAILQIQNGSSSVQLDPQDAYTRKLQHQVLDSNSLVSISYGKEPERYIKVFKKTEKGW
jgi:Predicted RNA-binding protein